MRRVDRARLRLGIAAARLMRVGPLADAARMTRYILVRLLRRGPTRDEAFDRFAGSLGGPAAARGTRGGVSPPAKRGLRSTASLDVAMREEARGGDRERAA
jgi:hypothetical protein